jgi:hypothetical protein
VGWINIHPDDEVYMADLNIPVSILYSENAGTKPQATSVEVGQLWINLADGTFGSKNSSNAIVSYGLLTEAQRTQALADVTWGSITGDITQQSDLQTSLNAKANLSGAAFTGTVTISGQSVATVDQIPDVSGFAPLTGATFTGNVTAPAFIGNVSSATVLQNTRTIDGISFNGSANISHYAVCSTAVDAIAKTVTITGFTLDVGATAIVTLTNGNSATSPTLDISGTGAKAIVNSGKALANVTAGITLMVVYDGTNYQVVGDVDSIDFSQYYTKEEMDAKFLPIMKPSAKGTLSIYAQTEAEAEPVITAYNAAKQSAAQNSGALNCYTKEETDALFATIVNPVIIDTLTVEDEEVTQ